MLCHPTPKLNGAAAKRICVFCMPLQTCLKQLVRYTWKQVKQQGAAACELVCSQLQDSVAAPVSMSPFVSKNLVLPSLRILGRRCHVSRAIEWSQLGLRYRRQKQAFPFRSCCGSSRPKQPS